MERPEFYQQLQGKPKAQRVTAVAESGLLENKRFTLSKNPEVRKNLKNFESVYGDIKTRYPAEVVAMVMSGSQVKGYATGESDFDSMLYIDAEQATANLDVDNPKPEDAVTAEDIQNLKDNPKGWYTTIDEPDPVAAAQDKSNLTKEAALLKYTKLVEQGLQNHELGGRDRHISVAVHLLDQQEMLGYLRSERYATNSIVSLFELSLDRGVNKWREMVVSELESQPDGQKKWQDIMEELGEKERLEIHNEEVLGSNTRPERQKKLYPTLQEARGYFLKGSAEQAEKSETDKEKEYLETAHRVGDYYVSLVNGFTGKGEIDPAVIADLKHPVKSKLAKITQHAKDGFERQHLLAQMKGLDAKKILQQVPRFLTPETSAQLADTSKYRSEELSPGVFALFIDADLYSHLTGGSAAGMSVKFKNNEGVSFIMLPEYSDTQTTASQLAKNVPHETHHLIWNFSKGEAITSSEANHDLADAFIMYQDEVMARLCSDGDLAGYTHLQILDPKTRQQFEQEHPDTARQITDTMVSLNELLQEIDLSRKQTDIKKEDLILAVMDATNFEQLNKNLLQMKAVIEKQPVTKAPPKSTSGWDFT